MANQFHDTQFGHCARFLFQKRLFRFPDEIDPSLCRASAKESTTPAVNTGKDQDVELDEKGVRLIGWNGPDDPEVL